THNANRSPTKDPAAAACGRITVYVDGR
ncbi:MAG: hypothetical protein ACI9SE_004175, partial [Neolewinella sp.]